MRDINQKIIKFNYEKNLKSDDFFTSTSNKNVYNFLNSWPKWEKNFLNICGEKLSGKSHLMNIFLKKFKGIIFDASKFNNHDLANIKFHENIIIEDLNEEIDEKLIYTLINIIDQSNKYLIITTLKPIPELDFNLIDLKSRTKNFLIQNIRKPDDELVFALLIKNLSDRQITIEKKLVNYIVKRIHRSYSNIFDFIYKIDEVSLKKKKSINLSIIREILGD
ncbi:DnaA/Hda family protein [Candidatus Pelagibacter sp.]|nr:DnaA/Hda family protein [Candidatus Pelagibacter sp.]